MSDIWEEDDWNDYAPSWSGRALALRPRPFGSTHPLGDPALARKFLDQRESWCATGNTYVLIDDMTPGHALAAAGYVLARATSVALVLYASGAEAVTDLELSDDAAARAYLLDSPLVEALIDRGRASDEIELPWLAARR